MSRLLTLQNQLKAEARLDLLTDKQRQSFDAIGHHWHFPERVHLHGPSGSGKTFVGWVLARANDAVFCASPSAFFATTPEAKPYIIDNVFIEPIHLRQLLAEMQLRRIRKALMISRQPNDIGLPTVELMPPSSDDLNIIYHNLSLLEYYAVSHTITTNLWTIIHSTLR